MVQIGDTVEYVSEDGRTKVGLVVATSETVDPSTEAGQKFGPAGNQVNLVVFNFVGGHSPRVKVPFYEDVKEHPDFSKGGFYRLLPSAATSVQIFNSVSDTAK